MLMQTKGLQVEQETEQLQNCRALLAYIDDENGFQKRLRERVVDYNCPYSCGTYSCLWGWFLRDNSMKSYGGVYADSEEYFGLINQQWIPIFGSEDSGDIHDRRAALVEHIKWLEARE